MTINQATCLVAAFALALFLANLPAVRIVKNCFAHGGAKVTVIVSGTQSRATQYTVICKDGSTYHRG